MDATQLISYLPALLKGVAVTLELMICALILGLVLAIPMTLCSISNSRFLRTPVNAFTFFIRGTPLLVQIFLIYYGIGQFEIIRNSPFWIVLQEPFACAVIAFAINTCGYSVVLFKGAIASVPSGEVAACEALGMSRWLMLKRVILPRAFRIVLPA